MEFNLLILVVMPMFIAFTLLKRARPRNWGRDKRSVFSAALSDAHNSIPFAFM
jgi:hypothetical protein